MLGHTPVLLKESIASLCVRDRGIYVDLTLGRAGHSSAILKLIPHGRLICFDKDATAIKESGEVLSKIGNNYTLIQDDFSKLDEVLNRLGINKVDGILADLGVSSPQFDDPSRGFSYREDGPLDMRMDTSASLTAYDVVNNYCKEELIHIFKMYGEEVDSVKIADKIIKYRQNKKIETTLELVDIIKFAKSQKALSKRGHPAKQIFQAIRIEVNHEEDSLKRLLEIAPSLLNKGGALAIISFMSLDDRLIKDAFKELTTVEGNRLDIPSPPKIETDYKLLTRKPIVPSEKEILTNHRAKSAKLRVLIRK